MVSMSNTYIWRIQTVFSAVMTPSKTSVVSRFFFRVDIQFLAQFHRGRGRGRVFGLRPSCLTSRCLYLYRLFLCSSSLEDYSIMVIYFILNHVQLKLLRCLIAHCTALYFNTTRIVVRNSLVINGQFKSSNDKNKAGNML